MPANPKNQPPKNTSVIPVYGSAKQIAADLHKIAKEKIIPTSIIPSQVPKKPNPSNKPAFTPPPASKNNGRNKIINIALLAALAVLIVLVFFSKISVFDPISRSQYGELVIPSESESETQNQIKNITSLNWENFAQKKKDGSPNEKLAGLLLLHEEESLVLGLFTGKRPSLTPDDIKDINITSIPEDVTGENIQKLIEGLINIRELQVDSSQAQIHINRLKILQSYFEKYQPSESDIIPASADVVTLDFHPAQNQKELAKLLLQRFNIFLDATTI
jgi:hypothetical protein